MADEIVIDDRNYLKFGQRITDARGMGYPCMIGFGRESLIDDNKENKSNKSDNDKFMQEHGTFEVSFRNRKQNDKIKVKNNDLEGLVELLKQQELI